MLPAAPPVPEVEPPSVPVPEEELPLEDDVVVVAPLVVDVDVDVDESPLAVDVDVDEPPLVVDVDVDKSPLAVLVALVPVDAAEASAETGEGAGVGAGVGGGASLLVSGGVLDGNLSSTAGRTMLALDALVSTTGGAGAGACTEATEPASGALEAAAVILP